jgi:flagellar biosynthetic protein FlhB
VRVADGAALEVLGGFPGLRVGGFVPAGAPLRQRPAHEQAGDSREHKDLEGNPQIKMKIRRLRRDQARRQMMKEVPNATAVVVNPTHFAVAIRYKLDSVTAPTVVAKGKNYLALRIRQKALENQVPIVENPPLAQALYKSVEVGQEIPPHLYRAVAEILAYIFKLMNGKLPG